MLAPRPLANYSLSTERRTSRGTVNLLLWGATTTGGLYAHPAQFIICRGPVDLGHAHRPNRHPAGLRFQPAPRDWPEHVQARAGVHRGDRGDGHGPEQQRHRHARDLVCRSGPDGADPGAGDHAGRRCRYGADGAGADLRSVMAVAAADLSRGDFFPVAQTDPAWDRWAVWPLAWV